MAGSTPNIMRPAQFSLDELILALPEWNDADMVEIGSYQGESTEAFARSGKFGRIVAVDPWSNEVYDPNDKATMHCDMRIVEAAFDDRMDPYSQVLKVKGRSAQVVHLFNSVFDFVYIDGDHRFEAVKADIIAWLPKLKPGGIIAGHDYGTHPGPKQAVEMLFRKPDRVFRDYSWIVYNPMEKVIIV